MHLAASCLLVKASDQIRFALSPSFTTKVWLGVRRREYRASTLVNLGEMMESLISTWCQRYNLATGLA
jgi:hypothetical protein